MDVILDFSAADTPLSFFVWSFGAELDGEFPAFTCDVELAITPGMSVDAPVSEFILGAQLTPMLSFDGYAPEFSLDSDIVEWEPLQFDIDLEGELLHFVLDAALSPDLVLDTNVAMFGFSAELSMPIRLDTVFDSLGSDIMCCRVFTPLFNMDGVFDFINGDGFYSGDGWVEPNADFSLTLVYSPNGVTPPAEDRDYIPVLASGPHPNIFVSVPFEAIVSDIRISLYLRPINIPSLCDTWLADPNNAHIHSGSGVVKML